MKIYLNILTAAVLINALNFVNLSYGMMNNNQMNINRNNIENSINSLKAYTI